MSPIQPSELRALAASLARLELQLEEAAEAERTAAAERREILELLRGSGRMVKGASIDAPVSRLARAIAAGYGKQFQCGELLTWCRSAPQTPERRAVREAVAQLLGCAPATLVGDEHDARRLGIQLSKHKRAFVRFTERGGSAIWVLGERDSGE
ncbi:MAG: hypothetical protein ING41_10470 [Burkholderiales bacterium]|jgi:hypothetical protein|nr:hypothetical protein [Burkholderiales bacterium]